MTMKDLKKIYNDIIAANPNAETKFEWGETSPSDSEECVCVGVKGWKDTYLFIDFDQKESFELFKEIYIEEFKRLVGRFRWCFKPKP